MSKKSVSSIHRENIIAKVKRIKLSGQMAALTGCILKVRMTNPEIVQIMVTPSDHMVFAMVEGHCGFNDFIGTFSSLKHNWDGLMAMCELNDLEKRVAKQLFENATGITEEAKETKHA